MSSPLKQNTTTIQNLINTINSLPEAGGSDPVLQDKTVTPITSKQTVTADSGYDGLDTVTVNAMPTATQATPTITISSGGLITASATQTAGYVSAGTKSRTKQLTTQAAKTITPSASSQTAVASGRYTTGAVTVAGDANLKAENIAEGVSIFGVTGTHSGSSGGGGGSFETATVVMSPVDGLLAPGTGSGTLVYTSPSGELISTSYDITSSGNFSFTAAKSTLCTYSGSEMASSTNITGGTLIFGGMGQVICSLEASSVSIEVT